MRSGASGLGPRPRDALALLRAWLAAMDLEVDERKLLGHLQDGELGHADLYRRARRIHERELARVVGEAVDAVNRTVGSDLSTPDATATAAGELGRIARELFDACVPAIPYAAAAAFLGREKLKLARIDGDRPR